MKTFSTVWDQVAKHAGTTFRTKTEKPFSYSWTSGGVRMNTTNRFLPRSDFEKAWGRMPLEGPGQLQDLQGPSYIYGILTDPSIN